MKALPINIYKDRGRDWSNGGISSRYDELLLVHPEGFIEIDESNPPENLVKIVERNLFGRGVYRHIEPVAAPKGVGWMAGGCIAYSSDSRFNRLSGGYPLQLHDRCESQELYDLLSR
ncbi:MAG: hypothetical protein IIV02_04380 [Peptococcaceae bacterium]|nr:hypothetical protein [Peptococcaceae bacterium]